MERLQTADRIEYIDMLKGAACLLMLIGHSMSFHFGHMGPANLAFLGLVCTAAPLFFFISGANIINFIAHYGGKRRMHEVRFYLSAAAALFFLSYCYSFNRMGLEMFQIFQGIAVCTAVTFLLVRTKIPAWAHLALVFVLYAIWMKHWRTVSAQLTPLRILDPAACVRETLRFVATFSYPVRALFIHFSLLPWVCYVLAGAVTFRSLRQRTGFPWTWAIFYAALPLIGFLSLGVRNLTQPLWLNNFADLLWRNTPLYFFTWFGLSGLLVIFADRWYAGSAAMTRPLFRRGWGVLEYCGRESFLFLIWHWLILTLVQILTGRIIHHLASNGASAVIHLSWILALTVTLLTLHHVARWGEAWRQRPKFAWEAGLTLCLGTLLSWFWYERERYTAMMIISFAPCLAFAYIYPVVRARLRGYFTVHNAPPAPGGDV